MTLKVLILGSSGFLGNEIKTLILERYDGSIDLYFTTRDINCSLQLNKVGGLKKQESLSTFIENLDTKLYIINCISARGASSSKEKRLANYEIPSSIFQLLVSKSTVPIVWVQPESFWQYVGHNAPDKEYVYWKDQLSHLLKLSRDTTNVSSFTLVLFHLIGQNDNPKRFLPRLFSRLQNASLIELENPDNTFYLTDVADVADFIVSNLQEELFLKDGRTYAYPFHRIKLCELVDTYLLLLKKKPKVKYIYNRNKESPTDDRDFSEIPRVQLRPRTSLSETLKRVSDTLSS